MSPPALLSEIKLNAIREKVRAGTATSEEVLRVFGHIDMLEAWLEDQDAASDAYPSWRERAKVPE